MLFFLFTSYIINIQYNKLPSKSFWSSYVIRSCRTIPCIRGARFLTAGIFICSSPALEVDCRVNLWIDSSSTFVIALLMAKNPGSVSGDSYQNSEFVIVHAFLQIKCLTPIMVRTASHAVGQMMLTMMKCLGKEFSNLRYKFRLTTKAAFETLGCFHCSPFFFFFFLFQFPFCGCRLGIPQVYGGWQCTAAIRYSTITSSSSAHHHHNGSVR